MYQRAHSHCAKYTLHFHELKNQKIYDEQERALTVYIQIFIGDANEMNMYGM